MSSHKFGYSDESLQKRNIENLQKMESQTKLINIELVDMSNNLEKHNK